MSKEILVILETEAISVTWVQSEPLIESREKEKKKRSHDYERTIIFQGRDGQLETLQARWSCDAMECGPTQFESCNGPKQNLTIAKVNIRLAGKANYTC